MNKYFVGIMWIFVMIAFGAIFLHQWVDYFVNPTTGIMVTTYAAWCPDYLVAFVGAIPYLFPLGTIIGVIIWWSRPDKPKPPTRGMFE